MLNTIMTFLVPILLIGIAIVMFVAITKSENRKLNRLFIDHGKLVELEITTETWSELDYTTYVKRNKIIGPDLKIKISAFGGSCKVTSGDTEQQFNHVSEIHMRFDDGFKTDYGKVVCD